MSAYYSVQSSIGQLTHLLHMIFKFSFFAAIAALEVAMSVCRSVVVVLLVVVVVGVVLALVRFMKLM